MSRIVLLNIENQCLLNNLSFNQLSKYIFNLLW